MNRFIKLIFLIAVFLSANPCVTHVLGNQGGEEPSRQIPAFGASGANQASTPDRSHSSQEIALSVGVLVFGAVAMGLQILVMLRQNKYWDSLAFKIVGLTLVITAGLFLYRRGLFARSDRADDGHPWHGHWLSPRQGRGRRPAGRSGRHDAPSLSITPRASFTTLGMLRQPAAGWFGTPGFLVDRPFLADPSRLGVEGSWPRSTS
jgi:hypothetical protein